MIYDPYEHENVPAREFVEIDDTDWNPKELRPERDLLRRTRFLAELENDAEWWETGVNEEDDDDDDEV